MLEGYYHVRPDTAIFRRIYCLWDRRRRGCLSPFQVPWYLFRYLGKSWIESKFSERLEQFKHQQAIEIQRLRVKIDSTLSGVLKIQEKEFETLPEAWSKLDEAYGHVTALVSPLQQYPNLDGMTPARLNEFLDESELFGTQKDEIRQSSAKL